MIQTHTLFLKYFNINNSGKFSDSASDRIGLVFLLLLNLLVAKGKLLLAFSSKECMFFLSL